LLIYHFKNKVSALEKNVDTMFEILNNVVGDLSKIKFAGGTNMPIDSSEVNEITTSEPIAHFSTISINHQKEDFEISDEEEDSEDEVDEEEDEEEEDSEDEVDEEEDEDSEEEEDEDSEEEEDSDEEEEEEIKKISVILDEKVDEDAIQVEELEESVTNDVEEMSVPELKEVEDISVEKIEAPLNDSMQSEKITNMQQYKKMHIQNLKKLVVSKGLATSDDVSKLKKADLLGILQEE
tara:strand:- start:727 stop:1437 length:711 start_codon:yes stop_codon:yes gene_type:complete